MGSRQASSSSSQKAASGMRGRKDVSATGERDEHYDVISVLYNALQGAETVQRYVKDAREVGDEDLVEFFEETRVEYVHRAAQAKQLLATRLQGTGSDDTEELEEEEEDDDE
jgi:hypothetical protein